VVAGVLIGVCSNSYKQGHIAGNIAARILRGAKPSSIPIELSKEIDVIINMKTANAGKFLVPPEFKKIVTRTIK
jgi:putative ABC transport system substrate-binding protein